MRALTQSEIRFVAGGYDTVDDIVVTGVRKPTMSQDEIQQIIADMDSGGGQAAAGGGGGGGGVVGAIVGFLLDRIGGVVDNAANDALNDKADRERALSDKFSPDQVLKDVWDPTGDKGWQMKNGSIFWDTDRNGTPDLWMQTDPTGNVWVNEGNGWENRYPSHTQD